MNRSNEMARPPDFWLGLQMDYELDADRQQYADHHDTWLRWTAKHGRLIPIGTECIEHQKQRAEAEKQRAERLAEQLRRLGVQPDR